MARRDKRSRGKREFRRVVRGKTDRFFELYREGHSPGAVAAKLQLTTGQVDELFELVEAERSSREAATVGGGG